MDTRVIGMALLLAGLACAEPPCKEECLRQLTVWQREASLRGAPVPAASVCDEPALISSESCAECEDLLRAIAADNRAGLEPVCDAVTEAS